MSTDRDSPLAAALATADALRQQPAYALDDREADVVALADALVAERLLLKKYMRLVKNCESVTFLGSLEADYLAPDDFAALREIEVEVDREYAADRAAYDAMTDEEKDAEWDAKEAIRLQNMADERWRETS
jgi:hypothetical protein